MDLIALSEGFTTEFKRTNTSNLGWKYTVAEPRIEVAEDWFTITFPHPGAPDANVEPVTGTQDTGEVAGEVAGEVK